MKYCARCAYPANHPLGLTFDEEGVCSGCRVHEEKFRLDWDGRFHRLKALCEPYRDGNTYDCIVPVSGARDSYFIVHVVKNLLGLNPLLVSYNKQFNTRRGVRNLEHLRECFDADLIVSTTSPDTARKIARSTMKLAASFYWMNHAGTTAFPVRMAVTHRIPLIIWGCHQGLDQVGMFSHQEEVEMTRRYWEEHDLMNLSFERVLAEASGVTEQDVSLLRYPDAEAIARTGVRGIYLNNFIRWDQRRQHEQMQPRFHYESADQTRTFHTYEDVDCFFYSDVHDYIKHAKHGYGKATDQASREMRFHRLGRKEAAELIEHFESRPPRHLDLLLDWLDIPEKEFHDYVDQHRNPAIWEQNSGTWQKKDSFANHVVEGDGDPLEPFEVSEDYSDGLPDEELVLLKRGHSDSRPKLIF